MAGRPSSALYCRRRLVPAARLLCTNLPVGHVFAKPFFGSFGGAAEAAPAGGFHDQPVGLLNTDGYFDHLIAFLVEAVERQFLGLGHRSRLQVEADPESLVRALAAGFADGGG